MHWLLVLIHIVAASIALLAGFAAMSLRKGSGWHAAAGTLFFGSMLAMAGSAAYVAGFMKPNRMNLLVALFTIYLVVTAWRAARHRDGRVGAWDRLGLLFVIAVAAAMFFSAAEAARLPRGRLHGMPAPGYVVFGVIASLCAVSDVRMLRRRELIGSRRVARHLWRMSLALLIALLSFYPGQARNLPDSLRSTSMTFVPHLLLAGSMLFWRWRYRARRAAQP